jgi:hypothetical protein
MRLFRSTLPNGQKVCISRDQVNSDGDADEIAADGARLTSLLNSKASEVALLQFIEDVCPVIFPEAAPNPQVIRSHGRSERGLDLAFVLQDQAGIGAIEIKHPLSQATQAATSATQQVRSFLAGHLSPTPVKVVYIIAGRGSIAPRAMETAKDLQDDTGVPIHLWSWDTVAGRFKVPSTGPRNDEITVVLVEVIDFSRRLLRRLVENRQFLDGIDDRKFEELVATLLSDLGLQDVELTPPRKDGGKDIVATHVSADGNRSRFLIECKHWVSGAKVTMRWAIRLLSVKKKEGADAAILLSSSGFGPRLLDQELSLTKDKLFLRGAEHVTKWIQLWERQYGSIVIQPIPPQVLFETT